MKIVPLINAHLFLLAGKYERTSPAFDLPSRHGFKVKLKALKVDDQCVREHFDAVALYSIHLHVMNATLPEGAT